MLTALTLAAFVGSAAYYILMVALLIAVVVIFKVIRSKQSG